MNTESKIHMISIELIIPNRFQPRLTFDEQGLNELSASIKEHGIIQPLVLRKLGDKYEIIAGERRYKAATMAGLTEVPAIISNLDDNQSAEVALVENVQRRDLTSIEEAKSYKKILDKGYLTQEQLAKKMGISQSSVANKLRLLNLSDAVQEALMNERISERHARSLLQIQNVEEQNQLLERVINERLTVRQLDDEIKKTQNPEQQTVVTIPPTIDEGKDLNNNQIVQPEVLTENFEGPGSLDNTAPEEKLIDDIQIETLDFEANNESSIEDIKQNATDIIPIIKNKVLNIFDQPEYGSLEDEAVNMNTEIGTVSEESPLVVETEKIELKEQEPDLSVPEIEASLKPTPPSESKKTEKRIKPNDLSTITNAYHELEEEIKSEGYKISTEEFDFEDLYQVIIKIEKQAE